MKMHYVHKHISFYRSLFYIVLYMQCLRTKKILRNSTNHIWIKNKSLYMSRNNKDFILHMEIQHRKTSHFTFGEHRKPSWENKVCKSRIPPEVATEIACWKSSTMAMASQYVVCQYILIDECVSSTRHWGWWKLQTNTTFRNRDLPWLLNIANVLLPFLLGPERNSTDHYSF